MFHDTHVLVMESGYIMVACTFLDMPVQKPIFHFDEKNLSYTINRFNFFKLNDKIY